MNENIGAATFLEASNQVLAWVNTLEQVGGDLVQCVHDRDYVVFAGCGSAFNAAHTAAAIFQEWTGIYAQPVQAADVYTFPAAILPRPDKSLLVGISRSGSTTESLRALQMANRLGAATLSLTVAPDSPMQAQADAAIVLEGASEKSVATTRSVTSMIYALQLLAAQVTGDAERWERLETLPQKGAAILETAKALGETVGGDATIQTFAFLGGGAYYGLCREAQLKIKEMALLPADAYPALDFRHGPKACVDDKTLVAVMLSDRGREAEIALLQEMRSLGARTLAICDTTDGAIRAASDWVFQTNSGLSEWERAILYLPVLQFTAYHKALSRGLDPDTPRNLDYYVSL